MIIDEKEKAPLKKPSEKTVFPEEHATSTGLYRN